MTRLLNILICGLAAAALLLVAGCAAEAEGPSYRQVVLQYRMERDMNLRKPGSVLPYAMRKQFAGLSYFPVDSTYRFTVALERLSPPDTVWMAESTGGGGAQLKMGYVTVPFPEKEVRLAVFRARDNDRETELWIPFADATNGDETYGAGRYVGAEKVEKAGGEKVVVDFNKAYNPTCAYNPKYACPLPPAENRLPFAVPAGEMKPPFHAP